MVPQPFTFTHMMKYFNFSYNIAYTRSFVKNILKFTKPVGEVG